MKEGEKIHYATTVRGVIRSSPHKEIIVRETIALRFVLLGQRAIAENIEMNPGEWESERTVVFEIKFKPTKEQP